MDSCGHNDTTNVRGEYPHTTGQHSHDLMNPEFNLVSTMSYFRKIILFKIKRYIILLLRVCAGVVLMYNCTSR